MKGEPNAVALRLSLAEVHALQQDFATAEQVYRDVLKAEPKNPVALNNLAWILAPRPEAAGQAMAFADRAIELYGATGRDARYPGPHLDLGREVRPGRRRPEGRLEPGAIAVAVLPSRRWPSGRWTGRRMR